MTDPALLEKNYPHLLAGLDEHDDDEFSGEDFLIEKTIDGLPVLKIREFYVNSPRDPLREGKRIAESLGRNNVSLGKEQGPIIILGFGLGYIAEAAAEAAPERPVIIIEKRREILKLALRLRDLGTFLAGKKIIFVLGKNIDQITAALSLFDKKEGRPFIIRNRALTRFDEDWYNRAENTINTWTSRNDINRATLKRFGRRWVLNLSKNLKSIRDLSGISRLGGLLEGTGIPVFLAAAGPTLDRIGPMIKEISRRCIVIAVDTSLRFLLGKGIEPDFAVSLDPQYWNFRHLDRTKAPNTFLVAESAVYPPCLRHPFRGIFLCGSLFPLGRFIEERVDPKGEVGTGGSVSTAAWDFARILGTDFVWIAGLDLSFPDLKTHFHGALFEEKSHAESFRLMPAETWSVKALRDGNPIRARNSAGGMVLSDQRLSLYAAWFENRFSMFPHIRNLSLSSDGLAIKGLEIGQEEELLDLPDRREEINSILEKVFLSVQDEFLKGPSAMERELNYQNAVKTLLEGLMEIKNTAEEAGNLAHTWIKKIKYRQYSPGEEKKVLEKLDHANQVINSSKVKEVAGFLFPDITEPEEKPQSEKTNPLLLHLEFSHYFYRALSEAAGYNLKVLSN